MVASSLSAHEARQRLHEIVRKETSFDEKAHEALEVSKQYLGVDSGYLTRIDQETEHWEIVVTTDTADGQASPGLERELQDTYCREVIEDDAPLALHDAPNQGWAEDPAFETSGQHTYLGIPLITEHGPYGTVCFAAQDPRSDSFSETETQFVDHLTRLLERELEKEFIEGELTNQTNLATVLNRVLRHNLQNDLSIIRGYTKLIAEQLDDDPTAETVLNHIDGLIELSQKARELENVITTSSERQLTEIGNLIENVAEDISQEYQSASIAVEYDYEIQGRVLQNFDRAIEELIENAVKHSGDNPSVTVTIERVPSAIEIQIKDNGPGLPDHETKVFTAGEETPLAHGSGLGLWLAYWIVTSHDGSIDPEITQYGTTMNITIPQKPAGTAQQQLPEVMRSRDKYKRTFEEATEAIAIVDDDGRIIDANEAASTIFGVENSELLGRPLTEFLSDDFAFEAEWQDFQETGEQRDTTTVIGADGVERIIEYSGTPNIIPGQHLLVSRDVTERRERERRYEAIFNQTNQFTALLEPDGTVIKANEPALEFGGLDPEDVVGKPFYEAAWWQHDDATQQEIQDAIDRAASGEFVRYEVEVQGSEENAIIDFSIRPITDEQGNVTLLVPEGRDITERKKREVEVQETKQRLELALQGTNTGIWEWKIGSDEVVWNESMERLFGLEPGTFEGTFDAFEKRVHPDDRQDAEEAIAASVRTDESFQLEYRLERPDGEQRWVDARGKIHTDDDGGRRMVGVVTDITERKERERELEVAETVFQNTQDALVLVDVVDDQEYRLDRVNEAFEALTPDTTDNITGMTPTEMLGDEVGGDIQSQFNECVTSQKPIEFEQVVQLDEKSGILQIRVTPLIQDDEVTQLVLAMRDITERKARERELERLKERYETLIEAAPDPVFVADTETGELIEVNEAAETLLGMPTEEIIGMHQSELHPSEQAERYQQFLTEHVEPGGTKRRLPDGSRTKIVTDNGDRVPVEISATTVSLPDRPVTYGIFRDVSEQVERERELAEKTRQLEAIVQNSSGAIYIKDCNGYYQFMNKSGAELFGHTPEGIIGKRDEDLFDFESAADIRAVDKQIMESGEGITEETIRSVDGEEYIFLDNKYPYRDEDGEIIGIIGISPEITEYNERERAL
jgi:PAS domain S-box-containing protein